MSKGYFDDAARAYVITDPLTPRPWINYLSNRRLQAFISQNAGGLLWNIEPETQRITRYQYVGSPQDRPGFYLYVRDNQTGEAWNPHFAPMCRDLDSLSYECRHTPGITSFVGRRSGVKVTVDYLIPLDDDVLLWKVRVTNESAKPVDLMLANYIEFGILEPPRELYWVYIQRGVCCTFDPATETIRYEYKAFQAAHYPAMVVGCSQKISGFECSREGFMGRGGSLENPRSLRKGQSLGGHELPLGGHGCGVLGVDVKLQPGESKDIVWTFAIADNLDWDTATALTHKYTPAMAQAAMEKLQGFWNQRLTTLQAQTGDADADHFINTWNPYQAVQHCSLPTTITAEHQGVTGIQFRDTTQFALAPANVDPPLAIDRLDMILSSQKASGVGPMNLWPWNKAKKPTFDHVRSDATVWQIYTIHNLLSETGDLSYLDRQLPFHDGGSAGVYEHILRGLLHIANNLGPSGLPLMFDCDWNDQLIHFKSPVTESVMLGMQLEYSLKLLADLATRLDKTADAQWCIQTAEQLDKALNSDTVWDGRWYRRLIMGDKHLGGADAQEGQIWLNPQTWSIICGCGDYQGRGLQSMDEVHKRMDSAAGIVKQDPAFGTITKRPGIILGVGENGGIFCHANTWAIIAEALLGRNDQAFKLYRQLLPSVLSEKFGADHYEGEPYVYASSIVGPVSELFGQAGITWSTGTTSWMYIAATQYILGIRPTLDGLAIRPCLPESMKTVRVQRRFRGCMYDIEINNACRPSVKLELDGKPVSGDVLPIQKPGRCKVRCEC